MSKIKIISTATHRKNKGLNTPFGEIFFDDNCSCIIEESLIKGTDLSTMRLKAVKIEPTKTAPTASPTAKAEVEEKEKPTSSIPTEDKVEVVAQQDKEVPETEEMTDIDLLSSVKKELDKSKYKDLHDLCREMNLPEDEWLKLKKVELIDYLAPKI